MNIRMLVMAGCATLAAAGLLGAAPPASAAPPGAASPGAASPGAAGPAGMTAAYPSAWPGHFRCFALYARQGAVNAALAARAAGRSVPAQATTPGGLGATDIASAYRLPVTADPHQTVAVVDAFKTPGLAQDLATYRKQYGLPACTVASGCLSIVNQAGNPSPLPVSGVPFGWDIETALDVEMVSAACPHCHVLVVEGTSSGIADLAAAEETAARLGASVISNSYGTRETGFSQASTSSYELPGHVIVASSGDGGFGAAQFPANLASVTAVGGTELAPAANARGWAEQVWLGSGSGCSAYVDKPAWQRDPHCPGRTVADVAAVADNVAEFDSTEGGWLTIGGTSVSAPVIAGTYALAGNAATAAPGDEYQHPAALNDITAGSNDPNGTGATCGHDYLCVAKKGYDAPTGLGTPNGTGAF